MRSLRSHDGGASRARRRHGATARPMGPRCLLALLLVAIQSDLAVSLVDRSSAAEQTDVPIFLLPGGEAGLPVRGGPPVAKVSPPAPPAPSEPPIQPEPNAADPAGAAPVALHPPPAAPAAARAGLPPVSTLRLALVG